MNEDAVFYVGQKALIRKGDEILVLTDKKGEVHYPGGKIQNGESDLVNSLKREVKEETGLEIKVGEPFTTLLYTFSDSHRLAGKRLFLVAYKREYISGDVKVSHEHNDFSWVTKENFMNMNDNTETFGILKKYFSE